jgi:hypothetical protein
LKFRRRLGTESHLTQSNGSGKTGRGPRGQQLARTASAGPQFVSLLHEPKRDLRRAEVVQDRFGDEKPFAELLLVELIFVRRVVLSSAKHPVFPGINPLLEQVKDRDANSNRFLGLPPCPPVWLVQGCGSLVGF